MKDFKEWWVNKGYDMLPLKGGIDDSCVAKIAKAAWIKAQEPEVHIIEPAPLKECPGVKNCITAKQIGCGFLCDYFIPPHKRDEGEM